jgi:hypothetical protein
MDNLSDRTIKILIGFIILGIIALAVLVNIST